ncbi:acyl-CoA dehydrogenase family protein [Streptomyces rimosus]|uniref:acyl-CoA dehydrogenase family protein n=1 Tax=Streptomyces rimosus TaxID=1927 RepID=UPI0004C70C66|nr:acyl-CoA dehydrogenase family protein [Streptomyces rimosus]
MNDALSALLESFESHLGDPNDESSTFSFTRSAALDRAEQFPNDICRQLNSWGLQRYYVPARLGGELTTFEAPFHLIRAVARRDLTVAIGHGKTFLGGVCAWIVDPTEQIESLARKVIEGHPVSWGLTERDHGSDLLAGEVRAEEQAGGYRITGEKWLINNATRGQISTVLARSAPLGGARGFDVFLVDKDRLPGAAYHCLPKVRTHGIRGADISGIRFDGAKVDSGCRIGAPGQGLETVLKSLQLTRTLCSALSLGAGEHALRLAVRFARERTLYGKQLRQLPRARRVLLDAYADHLLGEALALVGTRSIHALTDEMSVTSAVVKYLVPSRTDAMIDSLARFLGARSQLLDVFAEGQFQKAQRDHRIVGIFDGNSLVNLNALINEFPTIARKSEPGADDPALDDLFNLGRHSPAFDAARLSLVSRGGSSILRELSRSVGRLTRLASTGPALAPVAVLAQRVLAQTGALLSEMAAHRPARGKVPPRSFQIAREFSLCFAASAAIGLWLANHERAQAGPAGVLWRDAHWLRAALSRVLAGLGVPVEPGPDCDQALLHALVGQDDEGWSLSLAPHRVAEGTVS